MTRRLAFIALCGALVSQGAPADCGIRYVDLRADGALQQLRRSNPAHYSKVQQIVEHTSEFPLAWPAHWLPASLEARDVLFSGGMLLASYPPKQVLSFTLDDVRYTLYVTRTQPEQVRVVGRRTTPGLQRPQ
jgi:hypothetical protein